jgi:hypothetical protein
MKLYLPIEYDYRHNWNYTLCKMLAKSGMFEIEKRKVSSKANPFDQYFPYPNTRGARNNLWTPMELDGCLIGLDTWDTLGPTSVFEDVGYFQEGKVCNKFDHIIKIQYHKCPYWDDFTKRTGKTASGWTVMPTHDFPLENPPFQWKYKNHKYVTSLTGRNNRFGRQPYVDWCAKNKGYYTKPDYKSTDPRDEYFKILDECKWGLILSGRRGAFKNRREVEFSCFGMPMVLNYVPEYSFPMEPGRHFVLINNPHDLEKLKDIDPRPYAEASKELWNDRFSSQGMAKTLIETIRGRNDIRSS